MGLHLSLQAFATTYMDISIGLAIFIHRLYFILSRLSLSRLHQVLRVLEDQNVRKCQILERLVVGNPGWMSHEWHATGFDCKSIRLQG